jgi:hypothetical protein
MFTGAAWLWTGILATDWTCAEELAPATNGVFVLNGCGFWQCHLAHRPPLDGVGAKSKPDA